ncbi:MAG: His/Gly/Thr/Pro-type tRNA ligase C-terminal domain-containing protein, partial [Burkholderiaceae bacterium]
LEAVGVQPPPASPDVYAVVPSLEAMPVAMSACEALRATGVTVLMHAACGAAWGSVKAQFKRADASGARWALIFGADELARGEVALKALRDAGQAQRSLPLASAAEWAADLRTA